MTSDPLAPTNMVDESYAIAANALTNDVITCSDTLAGATISCIAYGISGANTATPFDTTVCQSKGTSTTPSCRLTTSNPNDILIVSQTSANVATITPQTGFTVIASNVNDNAGNAYAESKIVTATQFNFQMGTTLSASVQWAIIGDAIKQASTPPITEKVTLTMANSAPAVTLTIDSNCNPSITTILADGLQKTFTVDGSCLITYSTPVASNGIAYSPNTWSYVTGTSTETKSNTIYQQFLINNPKSLNITFIKAGSKVNGLGSSYNDYNTAITVFGIYTCSFTVQNASSIYQFFLSGIQDYTSDNTGGNTVHNDYSNDATVPRITSSDSGHVILCIPTATNLVVQKITANGATQAIVSNSASTFFYFSGANLNEVDFVPPIPPVIGNNIIPESRGGGGGVALTPIMVCAPIACGTLVSNGTDYSTEGNLSIISSILLSFVIGFRGVFLGLARRTTRQERPNYRRSERSSAKLKPSKAHKPQFRNVTRPSTEFRQPRNESAFSQFPKETRADYRKPNGGGSGFRASHSSKANYRRPKK